MGQGPQELFQLFGIPVTDTVVVSWAIMLVLWIFAIFASKNIEMVPSGAQNAAELFLEAILDLIEGMMPNEGKRFLPLIATIALFIGMANLVGIIPTVPNPTADLNTTLGIALIVFVATHYYGIEKKGVGTYLKEFIEPSIALLPLNIIGELAKPISLAFRLFGNMAGGGVILGIIAMFVPWVIPVPLMAWFDVFVGVIQAFIFTMLAIAYISVARG
ncbi:MULTISPECIES: F0F1 ATP synthase subunit A [unclassified Candidatus Frackibacter]|uniref:F0F1 ATP synthase subunit A n=1 Tax=unclassified Candidatus Frackibacter TaxID=2648818 RepID=UPI00079B43CD|nr:MULTISPECIES: F0F1 ATP synthase subunit A [unclassified Candidatus Frackibacter]KXS45321.1 MAG: F-type H+-transporting ATPase subunit a [Candidatus Frackibacter sp. T328-2]SDC10472.1 ATP synthase F0 subcomplex A subunit [Candidatus Frackibacter sp. WG11]SEM37153.1 ATP synthase F0 subcomplex A subunit [Candidatus Frackibacter sp. WG12]SFL42538.1 ATP synthase F0 subcomplex A subunit [Candidatus Frackibacter sp. WG13]